LNDANGDWVLEGGTGLNGNDLGLSVNAGPLSPGIEVAPGTHDITIPDAFHAPANLPIVQVENRTFTKNIRVTLASTPAG
jgi:hypothetical protein